MKIRIDDFLAQIQTTGNLDKIAQPIVECGDHPHISNACVGENAFLLSTVHHHQHLKIQIV